MSEQGICWKQTVVVCIWVIAFSLQGNTWSVSISVILFCLWFVLVIQREANGDFDYLTEKLTPRSRVLPQRLTGPQLLKNFLAFHGTWRFITALTTARHCALTWARWMLLTAFYPISVKFVLIYPPNYVVSFRFPHRITVFFSWHAYTLQYVTVIFDEGYKLWSYSARSFLRYSLSSPRP